MLIDAHTHIDDDKLSGRTDDIIEKCREQGIVALVNAGCDLASSIRGVNLAHKYKEVYCTVGIHPHEAAKRKLSDYDYFTEIASYDKVIAIGEIGLDYYYDFSDRESQRIVFLEQIELAHSLKLPIVIHLRDAYDEMYKLLKANKHYLEFGSVLHCYSGSAEMIKQFNQMDMYYSFGGAVTYKNAKMKREALAVAPRDRIILETDAPYLTPQAYRGQVNLPYYVVEVAKQLVETLTISLEEVEQLTVKNTLELFKKLSL